MTELIDGMIELLSKPERWTQGEFARNTAGSPVSSTSPDACCWCVLGALTHCAMAKRVSEAERVAVRDAMNDEAHKRYGTSSVLNDATDHAGILKFLAATRTRLEAVAA